MEIGTTSPHRPAVGPRPCIVKVIGTGLLPRVAQVAREGSAPMVSMEIVARVLTVPKAADPVLMAAHTATALVPVASMEIAARVPTVQEAAIRSPMALLKVVRAPMLPDPELESNRIRKEAIAALFQNRSNPFPP